MDGELARRLQRAADQITEVAIAVPHLESVRLFLLLDEIAALLHGKPSILTLVSGAPQTLSLPGGVPGPFGAGHPEPLSPPPAAQPPHPPPEPPPAKEEPPHPPPPPGPLPAVEPAPPPKRARKTVPLPVWLEAAAAQAEAIELAAGTPGEAAKFPVVWQRDVKALKSLFGQLGPRELFRRWTNFIMDSSEFASGNRTFQLFASLPQKWAQQLPELPTANIDGGLRARLAEAEKRGQRFARPLPFVARSYVIRKLAEANALLEECVSLVEGKHDPGH